MFEVAGTSGTKPGGAPCLFPDVFFSLESFLASKSSCYMFSSRDVSTDRFDSEYISPLACVLITYCIYNIYIKRYTFYIECGVGI